MQTPFLLYKSGVYGGQNYIGEFSWWKTRIFKYIEDFTTKN